MKAGIRERFGTKLDGIFRDPEKGLPDDAHLISKPRLRVQKMKKDSCETKKILKEKFEDCYGSYDPTFENTENLEGVSGSGESNLMARSSGTIPKFMTRIVQLPIRS